MKLSNTFSTLAFLPLLLFLTLPRLGHSKDLKEGKDHKGKVVQKRADSKATKPVNHKNHSKAYSENETITKKENNFTLHLEARRFAQGEVILLRLTPNDSKWMEETYKLIWMGKEIPITKQSKSQIAFLPIPPEAKPGSTILEIQSKFLFLESDSKQYEIELLQTQYTIVKKHTITVDNKFVTQELSPETLAFIQECVKAKEVAFSKSGSLAFQDSFTQPLDSIFITSPFYIRRDYNLKKGRPHGGVDFRGKVGTPIFALQDGTVVLAKSMYYEGNFTIIDHGNKIYTLYMHQSEINVKEGDKVKRGQEIGKVGNTGMSTGPHLHLGAKVADVLVNPLSIIALRGIREPNRP